MTNQTKPEPVCLCHKTIGDMIGSNPDCPMHHTKPELEWVSHWDQVYHLIWKYVDGEISPKTVDSRLEKEYYSHSQASLLERVEEWLRHSDDCILSNCSAGRPIKGGGYERQYGGKWYESKPVDKTPKCNCGLDDELSKLKRG